MSPSATLLGSSMVERRAVNAMVAGSSPARAATIAGFIRRAGRYRREPLRVLDENDEWVDTYHYPWGFLDRYDDGRRKKLLTKRAKCAMLVAAMGTPRTRFMKAGKFPDSLVTAMTRYGPNAVETGHVAAPQAESPRVPWPQPIYSAFLSDSDTEDDLAINFLKTLPRSIRTLETYYSVLSLLDIAKAIEARM